MAGVLDAVDQRTQLVGQNRLELLLFRLDSKQVYGVNVFKVREVLQCPKLTYMPQSKQVVRGVAHIRGRTIPIIDISAATGQSSLDDIDSCFIIITEYNNKVQGFLVKGVERIVNLNWQDIHLPPLGSGRDNYLTSVTEVEGQMIEVLDVEKILAEVCPSKEYDDLGELYDEKIMIAAKKLGKRILIVDDSVVARSQLKQCIEPLGVEIDVLKNGMEVLNHLKKLADDEVVIEDYYFLMISDIEMPEMDGYTLTSEVRSDPRLAELCILLHTSLSGVFNDAMVEKVCADRFLPKYNPKLLSAYVAECVMGKGKKEYQDLKNK